MTNDANKAGAERATLRARRTALLRECEQLATEADTYRDLYTLAPDMYGLLDVDTATVLECNDAMINILGYERDEIIGKPLLNFHPPDLHELLTAMVDTFRRTGAVPDAEIEFQRKDGSRSPASSKVVAIRDDTGRLVRARSVMRDITKHKQTELALRQSKERFRLLAETIDIVPWEARLDSQDHTGGASRDDEDPGFVLTYVGPQSERVLHFSPEQYLRPGFWLEAIHPDDRARVLARLATFVEAGDAESIEYRIIGGDGRTIWVLNQCNIIRIRNGPASMTGVLIDITDRKVASDRRERAMRMLDHRVKNTLAIVSAVADRTNSSAIELGEFARLLSSRVGALAQIHAALSRHDWIGLTMDVLARAACGEGPPRLQIAGPPVPLPLEIAQPLGMALRELTLNAHAHGALSNESGTISVSWTAEQLDATEILRFNWIETGGPPVRTTRTRGCGRYLIEDVLRYEIDADVEISFPESGLHCTIAIPLPSA